MKNSLMMLILVFSFASLSSAATFVVNVTSDDEIGCSIGNPCSLRAAIIAANTTAELDNINFAIPSAGLQIITIFGALPTITNPVVIDGYSQPGSSANTLAIGNNAVFRIRLNRTSGNSGINVLTVSAGNSTIRGLLFTSDSIQISRPIILQTNGSNVIEGCWFGLNPDGTAAPLNTTNITIESGSNNLIGGITPQSRNVISNSTSLQGSIFTPGYGIAVNSPNNTIQNNYIGTDPSGTQSRPNRLAGIYSNSSNNVIGGTDPNTRNIVSGNGSSFANFGGIRLEGTNNTVRGNYIGITADGANTLANLDSQISLYGNGNTVQSNNIGAATNITITGSFPGIFIQSSNNIIGGTTGLTAGGCTGDCNRIAYNSKGVVIDSSNTGLLLTNNRILGNSIYSNTLLGIDLDNDNVTLNDVGDGDIGANNAQNFPVITFAATGSTRVQGTFNSTPNRTFRLEFFNNPTNDSSGFGEGQFYIGAVNVTTNATGNVNYDQTFSYTSPTASFVSATATDLTTGDTSEFAQSAQVQFSPTAANVTIGGKVTNATGRGIFRAIVMFTNSNGTSRFATTNPFGHYRFDNVAAGNTYTITVRHKSYAFTPQVLFVVEDYSDLNFTASEGRQAIF